ncbi:Uncharacterized protein HZ326_30135, partial [Fusarium oxysporum f. sp. albedinis]
MRILYGQS